MSTAPPALPGTPADLGSRLIARLVDGLVILFVVVPLVLAGILPEEGTAGAVAVVAMSFVYSAVLDAGGGTLGKRLLRLTVTGPDGRRPGLGPGATRNLWLLTSLFPGLVGQAAATAVSIVLAISIAKHPTELGWHDRVAGTAVRRPA